MVAVVAAVVALIGGCGGGSDPSKNDYITKADVLCRDFDARYNKLIDQINASADLPSTPANDQALGNVEQQAADEVRNAVQELGKLTPPTEDQATVQRMLDGLSEIGELWTGQANADSVSDFDTSSALSDRQDEVTQRTQGIATGYGYKDCP